MRPAQAARNSVYSNEMTMLKLMQFTFVELPQLQ